MTLTTIPNNQSGIQLVHNIGGQLYVPGLVTKDNATPPNIEKGRWEFGYRPGDTMMTMTVTVEGGMEMAVPCSTLKLSAKISPEGIVEVNRWLCTVNSQIAQIPPQT